MEHIVSIVDDGVLVEMNDPTLDMWFTVDPLWGSDGLSYDYEGTHRLSVLSYDDEPGITSP